MLRLAQCSDICIFQFDKTERGTTTYRIRHRCKLCRIGTKPINVALLKSVGTSFFVATTRASIESVLPRGLLALAEGIHRHKPTQPHGISQKATPTQSWPSFLRRLRSKIQIVTLESSKTWLRRRLDRQP